MEARYLTDLEWRICHAVNIYVFRNGRDGEQPVLVHIPPSKKKNMRSVMNVIHERVQYATGYAKYLYKMDGTRIKDPCELEMYNNYVVASNLEKHFKCAQYGRKRSPLLVLNRDSKHVRVLKLQNQNYYEWLLKKKAVGEDRPPYIYPAYYTNENYRPQDLPMGQMGNYNPPETHAPGCCYPGTDGGNRTYRVDGNGKYVVNTVTVDVTPDLADLTEIPRDMRKHRHRNGQNLPYKQRSKYGGKIVEQTASDMLNANVILPGASQDGNSAGTSETEEKMKLSKKFRSSKHQKTKSHRVQVVTSEEYHEKTNIVESSSPSSEDLRKPKKSSRKSKSKKNEDVIPNQFSVLPPAPVQFRDNTDICNNNIQGQFLQQPQQVGVVNQLPVQADNQDILKLVGRAIHDPNGNLVAGQKTFFYSPEKLAEINSSGNIQPMEFTFSNPQASSGQWAVIQQPHQQIFQPFYAIEPQPQHNNRFIASQACVNTATTMSGRQGPGVLAQYPAIPHNQPILQNFQLQPPVQGVQHPIPVVHTLPSQQPVFPQQQQHAHTSTQCVVIPHNPNNRPTQQHLQSQMVPADMNHHLAHNPQFVALPNPQGQPHLQQVYQLGIVQQPSPQQCIQVDAKAMRQYVDNQKMMENRVEHVNNYNGQCVDTHPNTGQKSCQKSRHHPSEYTESELDIPYTPMKTYRLNNCFSTNNRSSNPLLLHDSRNVETHDRRSSMNPSRYNQNDRLTIGKVKSRNVAIQMGHPGASARALSQFESYTGSPSSELACLQDRRSLHFNPRPAEYSSRLTFVQKTPRPGHGSYERFVTPSKDRIMRRAHHHFGSSCSNQFDNLNINSTREYNSINARRLARLSDPILDDLLTIPPPTEFREHEAIQFSRHALHRQQNNNNYLSRSNNVYPFTSNDHRSESMSQYMYSQHP